MELNSQALEQYLLPFTNNRGFKREPRLFVRASGMHYWSQHGHKILDGCSGLFTCAAGHCRPEITKAVAEQLNTLDYTSSFMRGHPGAFEFATHGANTARASVRRAATPSPVTSRCTAPTSSLMMTLREIVTSTPF